MYFNDKLQRISIGGKELPVKIDMFVLEEIQEKYGTIHEFELKIKGFKESRKEDGKVYLEKVPESIGAINLVLPMMVREGCDIEGIDLDMSDKDIVRSVDVPYPELLKIVIDEFDKCFKTQKKETPSKKESTKKLVR